MEVRDSKRPMDKKGGHVRRGRHARGGRTIRTSVNEYNAQGSPTMEEAKDESPEFKKGGRKHEKRADGGAAEGRFAAMRMDKMPRGKQARGGRSHDEDEEEREEEEHEKESAGGGVHSRRARGGRTGNSPYSSGSSLTQMKGDAGREGQKVPEEPG